MKFCNQLMHPLVVVRSHGVQSDVSIKNIQPNQNLYSKIKMQPDTFFHLSSEYQHASLGIHVHCKLVIKSNNLNLLDIQLQVINTGGGSRRPGGEPFIYIIL